MKIAYPFLSNRAQRLAAMSLVELMVAISLSGIVLTVIMMLYVFGLRSFAAMGNYGELNNQSRLALDEMSREIRQATQVLAVQASGDTRWIMLANTNATPALTNKYTWDRASASMTWDHWQDGVQTTKTNLTGCDAWVFEMYTRAPNSNGTFSATTDMGLCKLINMS